MAKQNYGNGNYWFNNGILYDTSPYNFQAKQGNIAMYINYMLARTRHIFKYTGLPETIDERMLELYMQINGNVCIAEVKGKLYAFIGGMGGKPDVYFVPTVYTIANPALAYSANLEIGKDCVVIPNDTMYMGLLPMFKYFATLTCETDISMKRILVNMRKMNVFTVNNDTTAASAREYLKKIEDGDDAIIAEKPLVECLRVQPSSSPENILTDLIEFQQYTKASWLNFCGLQSNYNMKRESLNSDETQMNEDALFPLIDDMLKQRQVGVAAINAMFGTNITVELSSVWETKKEEQELVLDTMKSEVEAETTDETKPDALIEPETEETDATVTEETSGEEVNKENTSEEEPEKSSENEETDKEAEETEEDKEKDDE